MLSRRLLRIKAIKALYAHFKSESDSLTGSEKNMMQSIDKVFQLYHLLLFLPVEVRRYAESRIEIARNKKLPTPEDLDPNLKFTENKLISQLEISDGLGAYLQRNSLGWSHWPEIVKSLYKSMTASDYYKSYMGNPTRSYREDVKLAENFFIHTVSDNEEVENLLEEQSIFWADDLDFALIMVLRTLSMCRERQDDIPLLPKFKNEDDERFARQLFRRSLVNYNDNLAYIGRFTQNWDVDRIAFMDNLIMDCAMAELMEFDSIPVKVTLDEYIEIAKYYSTPGSGLFINGILDKIVEALEAEGRLNKTGRGLL